MKVLITILVFFIGLNINLFSKPKDLIVIDENVKEVELLKSSLLRDSEILIINGQSNIWKEIDDIISENPEIEQVHLLLPCSEGEISFNGMLYDYNTISNASDLLLLKGKSISLLFYGSNLAEVEEGKKLIDEIGRLTDLNIAASTTTTAGKNAGGDWKLEYLSGSDFSYVPVFDEDILKDYSYNF